MGMVMWEELAAATERGVLPKRVMIAIPTASQEYQRRPMTLDVIQSLHASLI
jgi:hypothetical protein